MTKSRITPPASSPSATRAVAARAAATDVKGSINLRIERRTRQLIDGEPVLVNWGAAPPPAHTDPATRTDHFQATLGPYLPPDQAPPISLAEWRARGGAAAQTGGMTASSAPWSGA